VKLQRWLARPLPFIASGRMEHFGLPHPNHNFLEAHPTVSSELLLRLGSGDTVAKPNVAELEGDRVRFEDGSVEEIDAIVHATGYRITFPFFDPEFLSAPENRLPLYKRIFVPGIDDLALVGFAQAIPTLLLSMPAGLLADRMEHRKLLFVSQFLMMVNYLVLALLILTGAASIWILIVWSALMGALSAIGAPAQQAILPRLVDMRVIASAVSMINAIWSGIRVFAPASAPILIALFGVGQAFLVTAVAFAVSIVFLAMLRVEPMPPRPRADGGLMAGFRYVMSDRIFFAVIGLSFFTSMFGMSYLYLLAIFARDVLDVGTTGFGIMGAATGAGALLGTVIAIVLAKIDRLGELMIGSATFFGLTVVLFAQSTSFELSLVALFATGFSSSIYLNLGMTTLQILVPNHIRGRVMGVWSITWLLTPIGAFVVGLGAEIIGATSMVALGGLSCAIFAVVLYVVSPELRTIAERARREQQLAGAPASG
jgi:MFS family permease